MTATEPCGRIAALVATPSKGNTGMRFVNDALARWVARHGAVDRTDVFQFEADSGPGATGHACVLDLALERYERIVLWGDFLIDRNWLAKACERVARERGTPAAAVRAHVERVLFGDGAPGPSRIVVGQCFLTSDDAYEHDVDYRERFARLAREARVFQMRDPISVVRASDYAGLPASAVPALDAALLRPALTEMPARREGGPASRAGFGVFFGRTDGALRAKLGCVLGAARAVETGGARWLRWLPHKDVPAWLRATLRPRDEHLPKDLDAIAATLRALRFVVTDTYHLALVSWSIGVPALCVGTGAQRFRHSVHDKKKEIFFLSQRLERFHVFSEESFGKAWKQARACADEIAAADPGPRVAERIGRQAERVLAVLDASLDTA